MIHLLDDMAISERAIDCVQKMLEIDPKTRLSAEEVLNHKFIKMHDDTNQNQDLTYNSLIAMSKFNPTT